MWLLIKGLALRFIIGRTVGGTFVALLALLVPLAGTLKLLGLPLLAVLGLVGAPLMALLAAVGLPLLIVLGIGGALLAVVALVLGLGLLMIKVVLPIVLVVWLVRWTWGALRARPASDVGPVTGAPD